MTVVSSLIAGGAGLGQVRVGVRPNIVFLLADDLGPGDLGCYGQKIIATPNIDRLAGEGMRFTTAYAGSPVCAPSRCTLLTGLHTGHAYIRDNKEIKPEGQWPMPGDSVTVAKVLKSAGYATACVGKWGLGPVGSSGEPGRQGFDFFYGYNCQRVAHNHYGEWVWRNGEREKVEGKKYVPDLMAEEAVKWVGEHRDGPFFLYFATTLPHVSLQAPEEEIARYRGKVGTEERFGGKGDYPPCDEPKATYAAMVSRLDKHVGMILDRLRESGLEENTVVFFMSDNGPTFKAVGVDPDYFSSAMGLRGLKEDVYEGGIREPLIVRWKGKVKAGAVSEHVTAMWDFMPTFLEVAGVKVKGQTALVMGTMPSPQPSPGVPGEGERLASDGISILPTILGHLGEQKEHEYLYWEFGPKGGQRAVRKGNWKGVHVGLKKNPDAAVELYDLASDPGERKDVSGKHPDVVAEMKRILREGRTEAGVKEWNF